MKLLIFLNCFQALEINANHWPSLDCVITVLYALNNYEGNDKRVVIWMELKPDYCCYK